MVVSSIANTLTFGFDTSATLYGENNTVHLSGSNEGIIFNTPNNQNNSNLIVVAAGDTGETIAAEGAIISAQGQFTGYITSSGGAGDTIDLASNSSSFVALIGNSMSGNSNGNSINIGFGSSAQIVGTSNTIGIQTTKENFFSEDYSGDTVNVTSGITAGIYDDGYAAINVSSDSIGVYGNDDPVYGNNSTIIFHYYDNDIGDVVYGTNDKVYYVYDGDDVAKNHDFLSKNAGGSLSLLQAASSFDDKMSPGHDSFQYSTVERLETHTPSLSLPKAARF